MGIASALHPPSLNTQHSFSENMTSGIDKEKAIRCIVESAVKSYASGFSARHLAELDNAEGVINMKSHNVFIAALGPEIQYYSALARSLDSSLGNMLENMANQHCKASLPSFPTR